MKYATHKEFFTAHSKGAVVLHSEDNHYRDHINAEELYQHFKARMIEEMQMKGQSSKNEQKFWEKKECWNTGGSGQGCDLSISSRKK